MSQAQSISLGAISEKAKEEKKVPFLREELRLLSAANNPDGSPAWMIQDPISNKFYRIGWLEFEILLHWQIGHVDGIIEAVNQKTTLHIDEDDVADMIIFLQQQHLIMANNPNAVIGLIRESNAKNKGMLSWLLHHYLFFRIPILRPHQFLATLLPAVKWIFSPTTAFFMIVTTLLGLFLTVREWDTFQNTFIDHLTFSGLFSYGVALIFSKCLHEFGHAITATRYGVRVGHMGIAMLVMFPMPYTDTSESWKLENSLQRLHIASAGIITELALAGFASLAWAFASEGSFKEAMFFLATTSWVLTLIINLSPFLRFDGYFILSDMLDFPNLHERAGAQAKIALRRCLLGFKDVWPEHFSVKERTHLILFALVTWCYRLVVFLGIALLVYYFFFKALGIILFALEILWFILLPIWNELKIWISRRTEIKANRLYIGVALFATLMVAGLIPWQTNVKGSGWIYTNQQTAIFTPTTGELTALHAQGPTQKGETLFQLTSPDISIQAARAKALAEARAQELRGLAGLDDGEEKRAKLQSQRDQFNAEVKLYEDELSRMNLIAPFSGQLVDIDENLTIGTWVNPEQKLAMLINTNSWIVDAFIDENNISRLQLGNDANIYFLRSHLKVLKGKVISIDSAARVESLPHPMLSAQYGGPIVTLPSDELTPKEGLIKVQISLNEQPDLQSMASVRVSIETEARAWLPTIFDRIIAVFIRESGF